MEIQTPPHTRVVKKMVIKSVVTCGGSGAARSGVFISVYALINQPYNQ